MRVLILIPLAEWFQGGRSGPPFLSLDDYKPQYPGDWLLETFTTYAPLVALLLLVGLLLWLFLKCQKAYEETETIYIPLLNEGTPVVRATLGTKVGGNVYRVLPSKDYDPATEEWEFPPGSVVACTVERRNRNEVLVAKKKVAPDLPLA